MAEATKKSGGQKSSPTKSRRTSASAGTSKASAPRAESRRRLTAPRAAERAAHHLTGLAGKEVEGVTALRRTDDGWEVELETVELRRIPSTTDVLATYLVTVDSSGELEEYRRLGRYVRGHAEEGS